MEIEASSPDALQANQTQQETIHDNVLNQVQQWLPFLMSSQ